MTAYQESILSGQFQPEGPPNGLVRVYLPFIAIQRLLRPTGYAFLNDQIRPFRLWRQLGRTRNSAVIQARTVKTITRAMAETITPEECCCSAANQWFPSKQSRMGHPRRSWQAKDRMPCTAFGSDKRMLGTKVRRSTLIFRQNPFGVLAAHLVRDRMAMPAITARNSTVTIRAA